MMGANKEQSLNFKGATVISSAEHCNICEKLMIHFHKDTMPKNAVVPIIYYCLILRDMPKLVVPTADYEKMIRNIMQFTYKHMNSISLEALAYSLEFVRFLKGKMAENYVRRLEELIINTNPKLMISPQPESLMIIMTCFY